MTSYIKRLFSKSSYLTDIFYQASGNSIAQIIGIISLPILTRLYSPTDFAVLSLFTQVVLFLSIILTLRFEYFINLPRANKEAYLLIKLILFMGILTMLISMPLIYFFRDSISYLLNQPLLSDWLLLAPPTAMFISLSIALQQLHQRREQYKISALSEIISKSAYSATGISGYFIFPSYVGLLLATTFSHLAKIIYLIYTLKRNLFRTIVFIKVPMDKMKQLFFNFFSLSSSLTFSHTMLIFTTSIPIIFISQEYGSEVLGQFTLVSSTIYLPSTLLAIAIGQVYYQRSAKRYARGESFRSLWNETSVRLVLLGIPVFGLIALLSPFAYPFIFGNEWIEAGKYAVTISFSALFAFITTPLDKGCLIIKKSLYIIFWHSLRTVTTFMVVWVAWSNNLEFEVFLYLLVIQMIAIYLIDFCANWHFTNSKYLSKTTL